MSESCFSPRRRVPGDSAKRLFRARIDYIRQLYATLSDVCDRRRGSAAICRGPSCVSDRKPARGRQLLKGAISAGFPDPRIGFMMVRSTIFRFRSSGIALCGLGAALRLCDAHTRRVQRVFVAERGPTHGAPFSISMALCRPYCWLDYSSASSLVSFQTIHAGQFSEPETPLGVPQLTPSPSGTSPQPSLF